MNRLFSTVFSLLLLLPLGLKAQFTYTIDQSIPVETDNGVLAMPWGAGLNAIQLNKMDLDGDGKEDIVTFDRNAGKLSTYLWTGVNYTYAPDYEAFFPENLRNWVLLRDFNCDGKKDLFTSDALGIRVYENITMAGETPAWKHFLFYSQTSGLKSPVLLTKGFSSKLNLQLNANDLPSISDVDGDGDLDIFCPRYPSGSSFEFHKNYGVERYGTCDSLDFERETQLWGDVYECQCGSFGFGTPCPPGGRVKHNVGKALLALDLDGDSDNDLIFSEDECFAIFQLNNTGSNSSPLISSSSNFMQNNPVFFVEYPAAYHEDVDQDGIKDIVISPNFSRRRFLDSDLNESVYFLKNFGTNQSPNFIFMQTDLLQRDMIDVGDNATPAFYDADADGDFDLFVGQFTRPYRASLHYYENVGTASEPSLKLVTDDFLGLSANNLFNIKPQFVDINHDTKVDLVFTASSLTNGGTYLFYILNTNGIILDLATNQATGLFVNGMNLALSENAHFADVDGDGSVDMLVGRQDGSLQFWKNINSTGLPNFVLDDESFLGLDYDPSRGNLACSIGDLDADRKPDLVIGSPLGKLTIVSNYREAEDISEGQSDIIFNALAGVYQARNLGGQLWPVIANIFKTDKPSILVGNSLGGIQILKNDEGLSLPKTPIIDIYPNPAFTITDQKITIKIDRASVLQVYTILGQEVGEPIYLQGLQEREFNLSTNHKGIFIFRFTTRSGTYSRRVVIR